MWTTEERLPKKILYTKMEENGQVEDTGGTRWIDQIRNERKKLGRNKKT